LKREEINWVKDGAVEPVFFADSNPKGLYILKEAHSGKKKGLEK
jgi:hypothetical protein